MRKTLLLSTILITAAITAEGGERVAYTVGDATFEGYHATPTGDARGTIVLLPTWFGLSDFETGRADELADMGFEVFAADLYAKGEQPQTMEERQAALQAHLANTEGMHAMVRAAVEAADAVEDRPLILMGYSMGGITAMETAWSGQGKELGIDGYGIFSGRVSDAKGRMMPEDAGAFFVAHGGADEMIPASNISAFADKAELSGSTVVAHTYPGVGHLFSAKGFPNYDPAAAEAAWADYTAYLDRIAG